MYSFAYFVKAPMYNSTQSVADTVARVGDVIAQAVVQSRGLEVEGRVEESVQEVSGRVDPEPYLNTYQINHKP